MGHITMREVVERRTMETDKEARSDAVKRQEAKRLHTVLPAGSWKGRRCFVVAGGPSLKGFNFDLLKGELVIAVNRAFEHVPGAAVMLAQDARLWGWYECKDLNEYLGDEAKNKFDSFRGFKTWVNCQVFPYPEDVHVIDVIGDANPDWNPNTYDQGIPLTSNSGAAALMLATVLGASTIYLLGFDMEGKDGRTANFHGGYADHNNATVYDDFLTDFDHYALQFKSKAKIINLNPKSRLKLFEFGDIKDVAPINRPIYTNFFTPEYSSEIKRLQTSAARFGLETDFVPLAEKREGSWLRTIYWRPEFLLEQLQKHKRDLVWVDADAEVMQYPSIFDNFEAHVGVYRNPKAFWDPKTDEYLGGTIYLKYDSVTISFLEAWIKLNADFPNEELSQIVLKKAIEKFLGRKRFVLKELPATYCQIFDLMDKAGEPVIQHYQASRRVREA